MIKNIKNSSKIIINRREFEKIELNPDLITKTDFQLIKKIGKHVNTYRSLNGKTIILQFKNAVGVVELQNYRLNITPKFLESGEELLAWLDLVFNSNFVELYKQFQSHYDFSKINDFPSILAIMFLSLLRILKKEGIYYAYLEKEENLGTVKGRLLITQQIRENLLRVDRIKCKYDDLTTDNLENQLVTTGLWLLLGLIKDPSLKRALYSEYSLFNEYSSMISKKLFLRIKNDFLLKPENIVNYNRMNRFYKNLHELVFLLIRGSPLHNPYLFGSLNMSSFLIFDTWRLFELLVEKLLNNYQTDFNYTIHAQKSIRGFKTESISHTNQFQKVDLLIEQTTKFRKKLIPVEIKYKLAYDNQMDGPAQDLYQAFYYGSYFAQRSSIPITLLFYASNSNEVILNKIEISNYEGTHIGSIIFIPLNIKKVVNELLLMGQEDKKISDLNFIGKIKEILRGVVG